MTDSATKQQTNRVTFTAGRVEAFTCPPGKAQAFMWDTDVPGLGLRVTPTGAKAYIVERKLDRQTVRVTIGSPKDWPLEASWEGRGAARVLKQQGARPEARRLLALIDAGKDPRQERAAAIAKDRAERDAAKAERMRLQVTGLDAWEAYCEAKAGKWGELSRLDHKRAAQAGGEERKRAKETLTQPGPLRALLARPLAQLDADTVAAWVKAESKNRPTVTAKNFRLLRAFINWCAEHDDFRLMVHADACAQKKTREHLAKPAAKRDALEREQLAGWFAEVRKQSNPVISAYLQALLLTGARREELLNLRWAEVDFRWKRLDIRDKVEGERTIPLTPYVASLLAALPRRNEWVFSSPTAKSGRLQEPRLNHDKALKAAGLPHCTLHGLRRSFGSLAEWVECPVGIVAQIQGHKPSALAEKHYRVRPIDLLRMWHEKIEAWMLAQAGIEFDATQAEQKGLRVITAA